MSCGNSKTGRNIPKTLGSSKAGDAIALMLGGITKGEAPRIIALIRNQLRAHKVTTVRNPASHAMNNMLGAYKRIVPTDDGFRDEGEEITNGCAICVATTTMECEAAVGLADGHLTALPRLTRSEKGTRNFTEAVNQTQYRTCAPCLRSINVSSPASAATAVDCHK